MYQRSKNPEKSEIVLCRSFIGILFVVSLLELLVGMQLSTGRWNKTLLQGSEFPCERHAQNFQLYVLSTAFFFIYLPVVSFILLMLNPYNCFN